MVRSNAGCLSSLVTPISCALALTAKMALPHRGDANRRSSGIRRVTRTSDTSKSRGPFAKLATHLRVALARVSCLSHSCGSKAARQNLEGCAAGRSPQVM